MRDSFGVFFCFLLPFEPKPKRRSEHKNLVVLETLCHTLKVLPHLAARPSANREALMDEVRMVQALGHWVPSDKMHGRLFVISPSMSPAAMLKS